MAVTTPPKGAKYPKDLFKSSALLMKAADAAQAAILRGVAGSPRR